MKTNLSMTTDYAKATGCPEPYLRRIAEAGFTHVHWCHQWNTDFLYVPCEVEQIAAWLKAYGLGVTDLHASHGSEKRFASDAEYERLAGVELVRNRIHMARRLGTDVIILHLPGAGTDLGPAYRSLDALLPELRESGVRIALENASKDGFEMIDKAFDRYDADTIGLCYDCGHGHWNGRGLDDLERRLDRLISVHLHDNDGTGDQHKIPFTGTVDWTRLARLLAKSPYRKWVNLESTLRCTGLTDEGEFLRLSREASLKLTGLIEAARAS